jgi:DNA-binding NtrC family response regulator
MIGIPASSSPVVVWLDDDLDVQFAARLALAPLQAQVLTAGHPRELPALLAAHAVDVVVLDLNFSRGATDGAEGLACLSELLRADASLPVVVASAYGDVDRAVEAMRRGAVDFITKPWTEQRLLATLRSALRLRASHRQAADEGARLTVLTGAAGRNENALLGDSAQMHKLRELLARAAPTDANVLLLGENGTGKELAARELHRLSRRSARPFVSIDVGALSASVIDSELFGHKRGAFTDARSDRIGRLQAAEGGTVFLDEIANLPLESNILFMTIMATTMPYVGRG